MNQNISFKDRVVIITGAGGGLGKQYALRFAERGAKVIVNDLGGTLSGSGQSTRAADDVVNEIRAKGGIAIANYDNIVTNPEGILRTARSNFGTVHILINNAGILKDASFKNMTEKQFQDVIDVHLNGAFRLTKACWPLFKQQNYGRVVMTASPAGLYGNFGQANYSAAKMALVGFAETLAKEGGRNNIFVNTIAPLAKSRMTETIMPADVLEQLLPEKIAPMVMYLTSDSPPSSGSIYEVAAGMFAQIRWERSNGLYLNPSAVTPESFLDQFDTITDFRDPDHPHELKDYNAVWESSAKLPKTTSSHPQLNSLKDKVVIVTGAGAGLGRSHALLFAKYGAKVVVNDFANPYDTVKEIQQLGGIAVASKTDIVTQAPEIVATALDKFGTVDILVNNAGVLRDRSFMKMSEDEWDTVLNVHLLGTFRMCKLVWEIFLKNGGGKIINTTSTSGIYGNFGQANYAAAKAGILGMTRTLALEGKKHGIMCNAIAPHAETAMTKTIFKESELHKFSPAQVSPFVVLLASDELKVTGELFEVGSGWAGNTRWQRAKGAVSHDKDIPVEFLRDHWSEVVDYSQSQTVRTTQESAMAILKAVGGDEDEDDEDDDDEPTEPDCYKFSYKDVILYNLSVGARADQLQYTYESNENFQVLPSFGVIPFMNQEDGGLDLDKLLNGYNYVNLLHGEHYVKLNSRIPTSGSLKTKSFPISVSNKGPHSLVRSGYETYDSNGKLILTNIGSYFIRNSRSKSGRDLQLRPVEAFATKDFSAPDREPDYVCDFKTSKDQAALYRLNGDMNPLHIDPKFAQAAHFKTPILHGLCTYGISAKLLVDQFGPFTESKVRFTQVVLPGETIRVKAWKEGDTVIFQTFAVDRNIKVIDKAAIRLDTEKAKL